MAIMVGVVGALSAFYPDSANIGDRKTRERACLRMIAKVPTLAAMAYRTAHGLPIIYPRSDLTYGGRRLTFFFPYADRPLHTADGPHPPGQALNPFGPSSSRFCPAAENLLHMIFALPTEPYTIDPVISRALDVILMLHLDHEQNASTSTVRTAGSSLVSRGQGSGEDCRWAGRVAWSLLPDDA